MRHARFYFPAAFLLAVLFAIPVLLWGSAFAQDKGKEKPAAAPVKWEYKVISPAGGARQIQIDEGKMEEALNNLGKEGWECVGTVSEVMGGDSGVGRQQPNWTRAVLIFKRAKQ